MNPHLAVPLLAALIAAASASVIVALNPRELANRVGALTMGSIAWWASCEVMWKYAGDASAALAWHRAAAPGIVFLGAHAVWFLSTLGEPRLPRLDRLVPVLYAVNALFLGLTWSGPLVFAEMEPGPFGWVLVPGPLLTAWYAETVLVVGFGLAEWVRAARRSPERAEGVYAARIGIFVVVAAAAAGVSDVLFATLGIDTLRVGSLLVSLVGLAVIVMVGQLGLSRMNAAGVSQRIVHLLPDGVALLRPSGRIRICNPSMAELIGCDLETAQDRVFSDHLDLPVLDPGVEYRAQECELLQDSGFRVPVSVSTARVSGVKGAEDDVLLIARDVREVAALRNRLATSERLAIVGQLAGGIAHEINNPLAFVRSNLHHLDRESHHLGDKVDGGPVGDSVRDVVDEFREVIAESLEGIGRAMQIVRDVNLFSDAGGDLSQRIDLGEVIDQVLGVAGMGLPPEVELRRPTWPPGGVEVMGSPQRLKQLFSNVIVNAIQAVGDSGTVRVDARREQRSVLVAVTDDGCGMPPGDRSRIFEPFFTTRQTEGGTGLGLAVCREIARSHGGSIEVTSHQGRGTRVEVTLPSAPAED